VSTLRKLKKTIVQKQPAILFVPSDTFDPDGADVITVTDEKIYNRVLEGIEQALQSGRPGVTKTKPQSERRIII